MFMNEVFHPRVWSIVLVILLIGLLNGCETSNYVMSETISPTITLSPTQKTLPTVTTSFTPSIEPSLTATLIEEVLRPKIISEWEVNSINNNQVREPIITDIAWSPNNTDFAVATFNNHKGSIELFNIATSMKVWSIETGYTTDLDFSPDGKVLAASLPTWGVIQLWDTATGEITHEIEENDCAVGIFLGYHSNGNEVITGYDVGKGPYETIINSWDIETGQCKGEEIRRDGFLESLEVNHTNNLLVSNFHRIQDGASQQVIIWDIETYEQICNVPGIGFAFNHDSDIMAVLDHDRRQIGLWNIATCHLLGIMMVDIDVLRFDINPDGHLLAVAAGDRFQLWDTLNGVKVFEAQEFPEFVTELDFSPDGRFILVASPAEPGEKSMVSLWRLMP
jgi:WD40 repeat protein